MGSILPRLCILPTFKIRSGKGVFWGRVGGCFVYVHIPKRGLWMLSKEQGLVVVFWAKWDPIWATWDPSGQFIRKVGKTALELGEKIQSCSSGRVRDCFQISSNLFVDASERACKACKPISRGLLPLSWPSLSSSASCILSQAPQRKFSLECARSRSFFDRRFYFSTISTRLHPVRLKYCAH